MENTPRIICNCMTYYKNAILFDEFIKLLGDDLTRDGDKNDTADKKKVTATIGNITQKLKKDSKRALLA